MAVDLRCPNCEDNLGKTTENPILTGCGTCGQQDIYNPDGYDDDLTEEDKKKIALIKKKRR